MESFDALFDQAESALSNGAAVLGLISNSAEIATDQKQRIAVGVSRLTERIAINGRLALESLGRGDEAGCRLAAEILIRHIEVARSVLPNITARLTQGVLNA